MTLCAKYILVIIIIIIIILKPSSDVCSDVVAHDFDLLFDGQIFESKQFGRLKVIVLQTVTDRANITIANI